MKKRLLFGSLALSFLLFNGYATPTNAYTDVPPTHNNYEDITYLLERNIIEQRTTYGISDIVTREDVAVMIAKALQLDGTPRTTKFSDVPASHKNSGYIQSAVEAGIINGYEDGAFKPNGKITRGHMATFIARAFTLPNGAQSFSDVPNGHTAYEAVQQLAAAGITTGYEDGTFRPAQNLSRAHISAFLTRALVYRDVHSFDVDAFLQTVYANDSLENQLVQLNEQQAATTALLNQENDALNTLIAQKKALETTIAVTKDKLNPIQAQVESYQTAISAANAEIAAYRTNNKHLVNGTAKQKDTYLQTLEALQTAYAKLQKDKEATLAKRDQLHTEYTKQQASLNQLRTAIQTKQQVVNKQQEIAAALKTATTNVNTTIAAIQQEQERAHAEKERELAQKQYEEQQLANETQTTIIHKTQAPSQSTKQPELALSEENTRYTASENSEPWQDNTSQVSEEPYDIYLDYLTDDERELARLINEYRISLGLEPFTISRSLTIVARTHVVDSNTYEPKNGVDKRGVACNSHSWSSNGNWTPVCYTGDHHYAEGMWDKPRELTDYPGNGYEISVGASQIKLSPTSALKAWQGSTLHNNVIIGDGY